VGVTHHHYTKEEEMPNYIRVFEENSIYFFTIVTYKRRPLLRGKMPLLTQAFESVISKIPYKLLAYVILDDHLHLLIKPETAKTYPDIIRQIKTFVSKHCDVLVDDLSASMKKKGEKGIWQRRYFEHTVRNIEDFKRHLDYIHYNPVKHAYVDSVKEYPYSSFHQWAKYGYYDVMWGSQKDVRNIDEMNLE
jgi:putative transposase